MGTVLYKRPLSDGEEPETERGQLRESELDIHVVLEGLSWRPNL